MDEALWIEGNLSIDYGGFLKDPSSRNFGLIFDPILMEKAFELPPELINIEKNSYFNNLIDWNRPENIVVFPFSQHFVIKQDLIRGELLNVEDIEKQTKTFLGIKGFKTMKGEDIKKPLFMGMMVSSIVNMTIIIFLLIKLLL